MKTRIPAQPKVSLEKTSSADTARTVPDYLAASLTAPETRSLLQTRSAPTEPVLSGWVSYNPNCANWF